MQYYVVNGLLYALTNYQVKIFEKKFPQPSPLIHNARCLWIYQHGKLIDKVDVLSYSTENNN